MAGHVGFGDGCYVYEDALYAAVRVLSIRQASDETLAGFRDSLPQLASTPELRVHCPEARKKAEVAAVRARLAAEGAQVTALAGLRAREGGGWWLRRASNTERSAERRVGKECVSTGRSRRSTDNSTNKSHTANT